ncbi:hypothetical protein BH10ACI2_BH10ACI2_25450 [soil metagenome]
MLGKTTETFTISSVESDLRLEFSEIKGEFLTVRLHSKHLTAFRKITTFTDSHGIPNLLEKLSLLEKPWDGEEGWEALEGDFAIFASCTRLGSVSFRIQLRGYSEAEDWRAETILLTEMGQLKKIARSAWNFFGPSPY